MYNFDQHINRENTNSVKYDLRAKLFKKEDVIPMWVADMDFQTPEFIREAIRKEAEKDVFGYTFRSQSFNESIVNWLLKRHAWSVESQHISFTPGVVPGLALLVNAFTSPGDKIIIQPPVYHPFFASILDHGRQLVSNALKFENNRYTMDFSLLKSQIDQRTKMIVISNPHNPVGRVWSKEELLELSEICLKNDILMVSDEIHSDLIFRPHQHCPLATVSEAASQQCITLMAPSKTFNLAGLSSSFLIIENEKLLHRYNEILEAYHLSLGNIFGNVALETAYNEGEAWLEQLLTYLKNNIEWVRQFLVEEMPQVKLVEPEGTYLLWLDFSALNYSDQALNHFIIHQAGLGLNQGKGFGKEGSGFMRMNIACSLSVVKKAMHQLKDAIGQKKEAS
ncbi:MAG: PatB family C-S lyase [Bacteroidales bacterium]|nr:PatB family C-S lyase [Bacteroidales bacterium]